jgi:hypothetical protein
MGITAEKVEIKCKMIYLMIAINGQTCCKEDKNILVHVFHYTRIVSAGTIANILM